MESLQWYLATWPDERVTLLGARDVAHLYDKLSQYGDANVCWHQKIDYPESIILNFKPKISATNNEEDDFVTKAMPKSGVSTLSAIEELWKTGKMSDVTICAGDASYKCHKLILASVCPYFDKMFNSGMRESSRDRVTIEGFPPIILETILKFIYTGNVKIDMKQMTELFHDVELSTLLEHENTNNIETQESTQNCTNTVEPQVAEKVSKLYNESSVKTKVVEQILKFGVETQGSEQVLRVDDHVNTAQSSEPMCQEQITANSTQRNCDEHGDVSRSLCECTEHCIQDTRNTQTTFMFWRDLYYASEYFQLEQLREYCIAYLACICKKFSCVCIERSCPCNIGESFRLTSIVYNMGVVHNEDTLKQCAAEVIRVEMSRHIWTTLRPEYWLCEYYNLHEDLRSLIAHRQTQVKRLNIAPFVKEAQFYITLLLHKWKQQPSRFLLEKIKTELLDPCSNQSIDGNFLDDINALHLLAEGVKSKEDLDLWSEAMDVMTSAGARLNKQNQHGDTALHTLSKKFNNPFNFIYDMKQNFTEYDACHEMLNRCFNARNTAGFTANKFPYAQQFNAHKFGKEDLGVELQLNTSCFMNSYLTTEHSFQKEALERIRHDLRHEFVSSYLDRMKGSQAPVQFELCEDQFCSDKTCLFQSMADTLYPRFDEFVNDNLPDNKTCNSSYTDNKEYYSLMQETLCQDLLANREGYVHYDNDSENLRSVPSVDRLNFKVSNIMDSLRLG